MVERVKEAGARGVLSVAGSPPLRVYDVDFGFGPPAKVEIVSEDRCHGGGGESRRRHGGGHVAAAGRHGDVPEVLRRCRRVALVVAQHGHSLMDCQVTVSESPSMSYLAPGLSVSK
ncbi:hypothetical protein TRIUR3_27151 [Triticum urartu]|uniref:Uncharacterized protein n=1 Tax=Triticum urartu TaxID=4572 RepID=M7ZXB8_TRIUA|nr:hypothetical protein TRIUR3_27151 [Triticum urartu]